MKDPLQPTRCARLLAALAAPERLRIIGLLRHGPLTVSAIAHKLREPAVNASHHLTVLRQARLVRSTRKGRFRVYSLCPSVFRPGADAPGPEHLDLGCCRIEIPRAPE